MVLYIYFVKTLNRSQFAQNLIAIRKQKGVSQRDLAAMTGISCRMIAYYETRVEIPSIGKLEIIAKALEVSVGELLDSTLSNKDILAIDTRILKKVKLMEQLPQEDQKKVTTYIYDLIKKNEITNR